VPINVVRNLLPQLQSGKITRGMIGVSVQPVPREALEELGLKDRRGALVATVAANGPAAKAGLEPGDVIVDVNGHPIPSRDELVQTVIGLKPGTAVPVRIVRDKQEKTVSVMIGELNLDQESASNTDNNGTSPESGDSTAGFGMTLGNLTADRARRLNVPSGTTGAVIMELDQSGNAARGGLREGDVILRVNRLAVGSAADASRELQKVRAGGTALLLVWRQGQTIFLPVRKE
jgi:serine protease Do